MSKTPTTLTALIRAYQRNLKQKQHILDQVNKLDQTRTELLKSAMEQQKELDRQKCLIDWCVQSGELPQEAMLKHTPEQMEAELRKHNQSSVKSEINPGLARQIYGGAFTTLPQNSIQNSVLNNHTHTIGLAGTNLVDHTAGAVGITSDELVIDLNQVNTAYGA